MDSQHQLSTIKGHECGYHYNAFLDDNPELRTWTTDIYYRPLGTEPIVDFEVVQAKGALGIVVGREGVNAVVIDVRQTGVLQVESR